jgi:hypothetical protein
MPGIGHFARWESFTQRTLRAVQQGRQLLEQLPLALLDVGHLAVQLLDAPCPLALGLCLKRPLQQRLIDSPRPYDGYPLEWHVEALNVGDLTAIAMFALRAWSANSASDAS